MIWALAGPLDKEEHEIEARQEVQEETDGEYAPADSPSDAESTSGSEPEPEPNPDLTFNVNYQRRAHALSSHRQLSRSRNQGANDSNAESPSEDGSGEPESEDGSDEPESEDDTDSPTEDTRSASLSPMVISPRTPPGPPRPGTAQSTLPSAIFGSLTTASYSDSDMSVDSPPRPGHLEGYAPGPGGPPSPTPPGARRGAHTQPLALYPSGGGRGRGVPRNPDQQDNSEER